MGKPVSILQGGCTLRTSIVFSRSSLERQALRFERFFLPRIYRQNRKSHARDGRVPMRSIGRVPCGCQPRDSSAVQPLSLFLIHVVEGPSCAFQTLVYVPLLFLEGIYHH